MIIFIVVGYLFQFFLTVYFSIKIFLKYNIKTQYQNKKDLMKELKEDSKKSTYFIGDSITENFLLQDFFQEKHFKNRGIYGDTTIGVLNRIKDLIIFTPKAIVLLIGVNDLEKLNDSNEIIAKRIEQIVIIIKEFSPNTKIYVQSIYPINNETHKKIKKFEVGRRNNIKIADLNLKITKICNIHEITYIDIYSFLVDKNNNLFLGYTIEGLHLNFKGYKVVADLLKKKYYKT